MRPGFLEISRGWTLTDVHELMERIERLARWSEPNGPLQPDEDKTMALMIGRQLAMALRGGFALRRRLMPK